MDETVEKLYNDTETSACFFRSTVRVPNRKCLIQITEKCNFKCKHCFLSANETGDQISLDRIKKTIIPFCVNNRINKITLTGGEPLVHPDSVAIINSFIESEIQVTVCTNGSLISDGFLKKIVDLSKVTFNVSLDAFSQKSFDLFRVNEMQSSFKKIISNIQLLGKLNILKGILVTPNIYVSIEEYYELCQFAKKCGAKYVLMNPLSEFGRGADKNSLGYTKEKLIELREKTNRLMDDSFEMVYIRFPNNGKKLSQCKYGKVLYLFTGGDLAICPYMVFACANPDSKYKKSDFILTNIFQKESNLNDCLKKYSLPQKKQNTKFDCNEECGRGCKAIVIANGNYLDECDWNICPLNKK